MASTRLRLSDRVHVVQPQVAGYEHLHAFDEVATSLVEGLGALGLSAALGHGVEAGARNILFAAHLLSSEQLRNLPAGTIVYNHEQIDETSMLPPARLGDLSGLEVWDYSARNVEAWRAAGIDAAHVPIGWSPGLEAVDRSGRRDIDVLFYGSVNERRRAVLDALERKGLSVVAAFGVYGPDRDALISRARMVINIQFYEARILEMVRLSYLFANGVPVVSEISPDIDMPAGFDDAARFVPYDRLVTTTVDLLRQPDELDALGERARARMQAWPWSRCLRDVVELPGSDRGAVELVCGPDGPTLGAARHPGGLADVVTAATEDLLALSGSVPGTLGPPPICDAGADRRVDELARRVTRDLEGLGGGVVADPALALVLPFWLDLFRALGRDCTVRLVVDSPAACVRSAPDTPPIVTVLRWLSATVFAEAYSREAQRTIEAAAVEPLAPQWGIRAGELAQQVHRALAAAPVDEAILDDVASAYLDAMAIYLPLLDGWQS